MERIRSCSMVLETEDVADSTVDVDTRIERFQPSTSRSYADSMRTAEVGT